jgi:hypothetical protein
MDEQQHLSFDVETDPLEMLELSDLPLVSVPALDEAVEENQGEKCVDKSRKAFLQMEKMAFQSDSLA